MDEFLPGFPTISGDRVAHDVSVESVGYADLSRLQRMRLMGGERIAAGQTGKEVEVFVSDLKARLTRDPMSVAKGDCVAVLAGDADGNKIYLMKVVKTGDWENGRMVAYQGAVIEPKGNGTYRCRVVSDTSEPPVRNLNKEDKVVPLRLQELNQFYLAVNGERTGILPEMREMTGLTQNLFTSLISNKKDVVIVGNVAL